MAAGPSLAIKVQVLFGAALLLIVVAALAIPWMLTERLVYQSQLEVSRQLADAWLDSPTQIAAGGSLPLEVLDVDAINLSGTDFAAEALRRMESDPAVEEIFQQVDEGNDIVYRYARGLRGKVWRGVASAAGLDLGVVPKAPDSPGGLLLVNRSSSLAAGQLLSSRIYLVAAGMIAVGIAILLFWFILNRVILGPVRRLRDTADRVEQGDYSVRADIRTGDDFEQLADSFNRMLDETERSADRLRGVNEALDLKVTELSEANIGLYESNRLKSEFLANVSHELKTPLNSIIGFAELLDELASAEENPDPKRSRYLQNIIESGRRLLEMISELLEMAKIEAGRIELSISPVSISELLEGLRAIMRPQAEGKGIEVELQVSDKLPAIETDAGKLQQILFNFLSNAVKFSPDGSVVIVTAESVRRADGSDGIRFRVTDHGPGVPEDLQETIFEKFRQADASHTRTHGGTGLGLAICRELADLLGGEVSLSSQVGQGSTFIVEIPLTWREQELQPLMS